MENVLEDKPKQYSPEEKSQIVRYVVDRYIQDLQQRGDIIFELESDEAISEKRESRIGDKINIDRIKTTYHPEQKVYSVNGEDIIVSVGIRGSKEPLKAPDYRINKISAITVDVLRKKQNEKYDRFANLQKLIGDTRAFVWCIMGDLEYSVATIDDTTTYEIQKKVEGRYSSKELSENEFHEMSKSMVELANINKIYELYSSKIRFQFPDKLRQQQKTPVEGVTIEVGDWPEKVTNLRFEEIMSPSEFATRLQRVDPNELTNSNSKQDKTPTD